MKNAQLRIIQIQNAPNIPYYQDSRILKVIIPPSEHYQYAQLSGLSTLYTNQNFNFQYNENNSTLTLVLSETKPNIFDIAYAIVPLAKFQGNSIVQETYVMQTIVSGILSPLITFELHISSETYIQTNPNPKKLYPTLKKLDFDDSPQKPYIPNDFDYSAIIKNTKSFEPQNTDWQFAQNSQEFCYSSDYDEEEDMIINARVYFNDETINLMKTSQTPLESSTPKLQQQQQDAFPIRPSQTNPTKSKPLSDHDAELSKFSSNKNESTPFIPPDENDVPFLLPSSSSNTQFQGNNLTTNQNMASTQKNKDQQINYTQKQYSNKYPQQQQSYQQKLSTNEQFSQANFIYQNNNTNSNNQFNNTNFYYNPYIPQNQTTQQYQLRAPNYYPTNQYYPQYPPKQNH